MVEIIKAPVPIITASIQNSTVVKVKSGSSMNLMGPPWTLIARYP